jgi:hypothetical protein
VEEGLGPQGEWLRLSLMALGCEHELVVDALPAGMARQGKSSQSAVPSWPQGGKAAPTQAESFRRKPQREMSLVLVWRLSSSEIDLN